MKVQLFDLKGDMEYGQWFSEGNILNKSSASLVEVNATTSGYVAIVHVADLSFFEEGHRDSTAVDYGGPATFEILHKYSGLQNREHYTGLVKGGFDGLLSGMIAHFGNGRVIDA